VWQGFGRGGAIGVASMRSCEKLPPCLIKPVLAGSKTDPPLAKAKPISDGGSASVITPLLMNKNGDIISADKEKAEALNNILPQSSLATSLLTPPELMDHKMGTRGVNYLRQSGLHRMTTY